MIQTSQILAATTFALAGLGVAAHGTFVPTSRVWGPLISHGDRNDPSRVALTFDDGPTPDATDHVLDILGKWNVKAAFFAIGRNVEKNPDLLARIDAEGHLIGNHSFDHSHWGVWGSGSYWGRQIDRTDEVIERVIGRRTAMFRPPVGIKTWYTMRAARKRGQNVVAWSLRGLDGIATTAQRVVDRVLNRAHAGDIISLHDGIEPNMRRDPAPTLEALPKIITGLRERGLTPVRLDELTSLPAYLPSNAHEPGASVAGA